MTASIQDKEDGEQEEEREEHYVLMDRHFKDTGYARWIFFGTIYVACYIAFMVIKGKEFVYQLYIPLDCFTTIAMASFYFYYRHNDAIEK